MAECETYRMGVSGNKMRILMASCGLKLTGWVQQGT